MTTTIRSLRAALERLEDQHGDMPLVLWDLDTGGYFELAGANLDLQRMADGSLRLSIGVNGWGDPRAGEPESRVGEVELP